MIKFLEKFFKIKAFGLDLSCPIIRVAQMPNKFASGASIEKAMQKADIKTKYVNACLPDSECFIRLVPKDGDIKKEIESNIPLPINKIYYDFKETSNGLFIVAAKQKIVDKQITLIKQTGLIIKSLEPESIAIARTFAKSDDSLLILKFCNNKTNFIICKQGIVYFNATQEKNHIIDQIQDCIDFYQSKNGKIIKIVLCGEQIPDKQFLKKLKISIEIAKNPSYVTATGLALKYD